MGTKIEWTDCTWNPILGCTAVSPGCKNCYAARIASRGLPAMRQADGEPFAIVTDHGPRWTGKIELREHKLDEPLNWKKPKRIFVNSMSDLFHPDVPWVNIDYIFEAMRVAKWHTFQVLTKRSPRLIDVPGEWWPANVWQGVSVENANYLWRIDDLRACGAAVKFLSLEPLLGPLPDLDLRGIDWVIVGGESGPGARPCRVEWIADIVRQCRAAGVPCFVKQFGSRSTAADPALFGHGLSDLIRDELHQVIRYGSLDAVSMHLSDRKGGDPSEWPAGDWPREFPR